MFFKPWYRKEKELLDVVIGLKRLFLEKTDGDIERILYSENNIIIKDIDRDTILLFIPEKSKFNKPSWISEILSCSVVTSYKIHQKGPVYKFIFLIDGFFTKYTSSLDRIEFIVNFISFKGGNLVMKIKIFHLDYDNNKSFIACYYIFIPTDKEKAYKIKSDVSETLEDKALQKYIMDWYLKPEYWSNNLILSLKLPIITSNTHNWFNKILLASNNGSYQKLNPVTSK